MSLPLNHLPYSPPTTFRNSIFFRGNLLGKKLQSLGGVKKTTEVIYGWYLMLWFAPNDAWDRPHEPIHIVNAFYDGPIGKLKEKCLVGRGVITTKATKTAALVDF